MTKSLDFDFIGLYASILKDVGAYHPMNQREWDKDLFTLTHLYRTRGLPIFTIDLPNIGKRLDLALDIGQLILHGTNLTGRTSKDSKIPRLFSGLWSRLFDESGVLKDNIDPNDVFFLRTLLYVGKNLEMDCAPKYLYETIKEYFDVEANLPPASHLWHTGGDLSLADLGHIRDLDLSGRAPEVFRPYRDDTRRDEELPWGALCDSVQREADRIAAVLGEFNPEDYRFRHGPGAVSDLRSGSYKYNFPSWSPRLETIFPYDQFGVSGLGVLEEMISERGIDMSFVEGHSKLIAVPKTQKGPRLIASEPTCHQWAQQCIRDFLYTRTDRTFIGESVRFNDQSANQEYARLGSLHGRYATLDLKSASDRLSCAVVQRVFRKNPFLLEAMRDCRTRILFNGLDKKHPSHLMLRKFSTQGSALTFPVQSLVFFAVAMGVGRFLNPKASTMDLARDIRVFGDDIIVPKDWVDTTVQMLTRLGLKVNDTKSFFTGFFRESCGADMWMGYDVTPPHVTMRCDKANPRSIASNVAVSNNFHKKGLWHAAHWIMTNNMPGEIPVIAQSSGLFGFVSYTGAAVPAVTRWNRNLHVHEARVLAVQAKARRVKQNTAASLLQYFTEAPEPFIDYSSGVAVAGVPEFRRAWVGVDLLG